MKKVFTSILLLAALSVPAYISATFMMAGDGDGTENGGEVTTSSPEDITDQYLTNADLSVEDNGWTYYSDTYKYQTWRTGDDTKSAAVEFYAGWGSLEHTNFKFSQTITLPAGDYRIAVNAFYREGNSGNGTNANKAWIFAGDKKQNVIAMNSMDDLKDWSSAGDDMNKAMAAFKAGSFSNEFDFSLAEETEIAVGFEGCFDAIRQWCILGPVKLYKYSLEDYLVDYRVKVAEAQALLSVKMGATELAALQAAIVDESSFSLGSEVSASISTLHDAVAAANASIVAYESLAAVLSEGEAIKANVTDEDAINTYNAAVSQVQSQYEAGTVTDFDAAKETVEAAIPALAKAQTADGSDMTRGFIVNYAVNGANGWTMVAPAGGNGPMKPSGDALEYWAGNANPREEAQFDIYQEITGLPNGLYTVSAEMFNSLNSETGAVFAATAGVYASVGDAEVVKLVNVEGDQLNLYTTEAIAVTEGTLRIGVKSVAPLAARWFVADNFKLTLVKTIADDQISYYSALNAIQDGASYRVFTVKDENKYYLNTAGVLVSDVKKAASFTFNAVKVSGTLYETGWNLGCKFTNPSLSNGSSGSIQNKGNIIVGSNDRNDWERQVFFLQDGKFAVRATNANSANWGANTYWDVIDVATLPQAGYSLEPSYVWEIEANVDERPAAFAKTQAWPATFQQLFGLVTDGTQWTSNAKDPEEGSYAALVDGDYATFFHSTWHSSNDPQADHYLQAELPSAQQEFYFYFKKRSQNNNNRPTTIIIEGSNDGESFADITTISEGLPTGAAPLDYFSAKITASEAYKYIRFTVPTTSTGNKTGDHVFFTASEWYVFPQNALIEDAIPFMVSDYTELSDEDAEAINALDARIEELKAAADLTEELAELGALIDECKAIVAATDTYEGEEAGTTASNALNEIGNATYTTKEDIAIAMERITPVMEAFFAGITAKTPIDVTRWYIVNPNPIANRKMADGWEGTTFGDASDGVSEYWSAAGAEFHQAINLPAGDYKLTVVALQRTGMTGVVYAGENQTTIVGVENTVANSRAQAAAWFAAGNGANEVYFNVAEAGSVEIGLIADANNGDHWTVWQSFKLEKVNPAEVEAQELVKLRAQLTEALAAAQQVVADKAGVGTSLFFISEDAYNTYADAVSQVADVAANENATLAELQDAISALRQANEAYANAPIVAPEADAKYTIQQKSSGLYLSVWSETVEEVTTSGVRLSEEPCEFSWIATDEANFYYLQSDELFIGLAGTNTWTMSALEANKAVINAIPVIVEEEVLYNLHNVNGLIASDGIAAGDALYANKADGDNARWIITKVDNATGISNVGLNMKEAAIFDLTGRKVSKVQKGGIYIINGKKALVK